MAAVIGSLRAELSASIAQFQRDMGKAADTVRGMSREFTKVSRDFQQTGRQMQSVGTALTKTITLPLIAIGATAAKIGIDFESSFAGVRKTVEASEAEFAQMATGLRNLAKEIPVNVNELNRLGEAAGALGIPKEEIVDFARVMAELGVTTNVTSDEAAEGIAKIQNIFGSAGKDTENFASTLVALGNAGASTEHQILEMATRLASAGATIKLTQGEVLGIASAIADVGIEAEAGGSAMSKVMTDIASAVSRGGSALDNFAKVAGKTSAEFAQLFKADSSEAITLFVEGLGKVQKSGGDLIRTLDDLGVTEIRQSNLLRSLAGSSDNFRASLDRQAKAWQDNSALQKEAAERFKTTESQLILLGNRLKDVGITLFSSLKPAIDSAITAVNKLAPVLDKLVTAFGELPGSVQLSIIAMAGIAAAMGPVIFVAGQLVSSWGTLIGVFGKNGLATKVLIGDFGLLTKGLTAIGGALGPLLPLLTRVGALLLGWPGVILAVGAAVLTATDTWDDLGRILQNVWTIIKNLASALAGVGRAFVTEFVTPIAKGAFDIGKNIVTAVDNFLGISKDIKALGQSFIWLIGLIERTTGALSMIGQDVKWPKLPGRPNNTNPIPTPPDPFKAWEEMNRSQGPIAATAAVVSFGKQLEAARQEIAKLSPAVRNDLARALASGAFEMSELAAQSGLSERALKLFKEQVDAGADSQKKATKALQEWNEEAAKRRVNQFNAGGLNTIPDITSTIPTELGDFVEDFSQELIAGQIEVTHFGQVIKVNLLPSLGGMKKTFDEGGEAAASFGDVLRGIPKTLAAAFAGGGGFIGGLKAIGTQMGEALFGTDGSFSKFTKAATGKLSSLFGKTIGGALGAAIPAIGALIGPAIEALSKLFGKLFGNAVGDSIKDFAAQFGGRDGLRQQLLKLGDEGERMWVRLTQQTGRNDLDSAKEQIAEITKALAEAEQGFRDLQGIVDTTTQRLRSITVLTPELEAALGQVFEATTTDDYIDALKDINGELSKQARQYDDIKAALDEYGIAASEAQGQLFKQEGINRRAKELKEDFDLIRNAGVDVNVQMRAMGESVREFVKEAQKAGVEVPEFMIEVIQRAIDAGEVFDENGDKITDINKLGLKFGTTMQEAMTKVEGAVDRLTVVLEGLARFLGIDLPKAAAKGADKIQDELDAISLPNLSLPNITSQDELERKVPGYAATGGLVKPWGIQHFAEGGMARGTDTVRAMLTPGEVILNAAQQKNVAGAITDNRPIVFNFHGPVLAAKEYVERELIEPILNEIQRNHLSRFRRLVDAT